VATSSHDMIASTSQRGDLIVLRQMQLNHVPIDSNLPSCLTAVQDEDGSDGKTSSLVHVTVCVKAASDNTEASSFMLSGQRYTSIGPFALFR